MLAGGSCPPLRAEAVAADVAAGGVVEAVAGVAAVLAVPVLRARCRGAEQAAMAMTAARLLPANRARGWERTCQWCLAAV